MNNITALQCERRSLVSFDQDDPVSVRDPKLSIVNYVLDETGSELGFFYFLMVGCIFFLLNQVDGNMFRIKLFLMNRDFHLVQNDGFVVFVNFILRMLSWISILMPVTTLAVWAAGLIIKSLTYDQVPLGGICVLLVGLSFFLFTFGIFKIKWNNFQFTGLNILCLIIAFLCFTAYQFVAIFLVNTTSYFGFSSIFLNANCMVMFIALYINMGTKGGAVRDILNHKCAPGEPRDPARDQDLMEEVMEEKTNKAYFPSKEDILDLFTIGKISELSGASAFGGGLQNRFARLHNYQRRIITITLWCFATGILVIYSYVIKWYMGDSLMGFVTMVTILITDVILYFIYNSKIVETTTPLAFTLFLNRLLLFVFGGDYWIYGFMVLYLFYAVVLSLIIANKRFPDEDSFDDLNIDQLQVEKKSVDVMKVPEFLLGIITAIYAAIFTILYVVEPDRIPIRYLNMDEWDYPYYINGVFCLLLVAGFFCVLSVYKLFIRKKRRIEPKIHYYIMNYKFDVYWIFILATIIITVTIGLIAYWITDSVSTFLIIALLSFSLLFFLNSYLHYSLNDHMFFQDITQLNDKIKKHNERLVKLKEKMQILKEELKSGNTNQVGAASLGLAQNIMQQDKLKKEKAREVKKIQEENINQQQKEASMMAGQKTNVWATMVGQPTMLTNNKVYSSNSQANNQSKGQSSPTKVPAKTTASGFNSNQQQQPRTIEPNHDDLRLVEDELEKEFEGGDEDENDVEDFRKVMGEDELDDNKSDISTDEELDPEAEGEGIEEKRQKSKLKEIVDWRSTMNPFQAFWRGKLRHNDYQIIFSLMAFLAGLIVCAVLVCIDTESYIGITICVPFLHYGFAFYSQIQVFMTSAKMTCSKYLIFVLAYLIQYGWGIGNLWISYDQKDKEIEDGYSGIGLYIVVYLIVIPFITSAGSAIFKWYDDKQFSFFLFFQLFLTLLQGIAMLVCAYLFMTFIQGIIISVVVAFVTYISFQVWIYVKSGYYLPKAWTIVNLTIVIGIIISATVVSFFVEGFRIFLGFSISVWVFALLMFVYAFAEIFSDYAKRETHPIFYSPWVFPVYIYNPKKNNIETHSLPAIAMFIGFITMIGWSVLCSIWVHPHHVGVALSILFEIFMMMCVMFVVSISSHQLKEITADIDKKIIKHAWIDAKTEFIKEKGASNRNELITYETMIDRKNYFRNYMRRRDGRKNLNMEEISDGVLFIDDDKIDEGLQWVDEDVNLDHSSACYSYLYEVEKQMIKAYKDELELIITFQLLVVQQAENFQEQKKKYLFTFLNEKKSVLFALGIVINIPEQGSMDVSYARVVTQIQKLTPEKQTMFNHLRTHFIEEQRALDEKRREAEKEEERKQKERQEQLAQMSAAKRDLLSKISMDTPVDEMPDCQMKYDKILQEADQGKLFVDAQFKYDNAATLGERCQNRGIAKWIRARDNPQCVLFQDKINHLDVVQGALGDCYFLSAISVLGEKFVRKIIISTEEQWRKTGAFCVQFFKDGQPEIIVIDDFFPAYGNDMWAFVKGGDAGHELWPMVLEKAYAKMYGSYSYIEAGKVQYALADMTDGFPEQMDLKAESRNIQVFWEKIKTLKKHGCLMGAGSPENALGDRAINEMGIVQGHAYAVLDVKEVDGTKLMQLRNPHGSSGEEWSGDWSDTSLKWTQRMRNKVGNADSQKDGVFWMDALDFVQQYSYLYICRILDHEDGWRQVTRMGRWKGASAGQLPSAKNTKARLDFCPQYEITVTKPCDGFVMLMQKDKENMFRGKHSIFFMVAKNNGKRIKALDKNTILSKSGNPINLNIITAECDFDKSVSYPYKFSLLIANTSPASQGGEGEFEFSVYATDPMIKVRELPWPNEFPKSDIIEVKDEEEML